MMNNSAKILLFGIGIIAVTILVFSIGLDEGWDSGSMIQDQPQDNEPITIPTEITEGGQEFDVTSLGTRADDPKYEGVDACKICHAGNYNGWKETGH